MTTVTIVSQGMSRSKRIASAVSEMMIDEGFTFERAKVSRVADGRSIELQFSEPTQKEPEA